MSMFVIEGPEYDAEMLRRELLVELPADDANVGPIERQTSDFFDNGEFGDSALVEFAVSVGENLTADALVAITAVIFAKVRARINLRVREEKKPENGNGSE
ncbi:hypothetical protein ACQP2X_47965 [Actinoplanes sp. CA-131856]